MIAVRLPLVLLASSILLIAHSGCTPPDNPIPIEYDLDRDGIPDQYEAPGQSYLGLHLYDWGARVNQTDLFVEVDYMDSTEGGLYPVNEGMIPQQDALQKIVDAFATRGVAVHFDVGDLHDQSGDDTLNPARFD